MKPKSQRKKFLIIATIATGLALLVGSWFYIQPRIPHPLGDKLQYIGKWDYGCSGFWLCDSRPGTTYIYATDLTPPELVDYFKRARAEDPEYQVEQWEDRGESFDVELVNTKSSEGFSIFFEARPDQEFKTDFGPTQLTKKYIVRIDSTDYNTAKDSL